MIYKIRRFIDYIRYDIPNGISNVIRWIPVIWKDFWFDSYYLLKVMKFKLEDMEKNFRCYGMGIDSSKDAHKMKVCINLLERLIKDEYHDNVYKCHDQKWGAIEFDLKPYDDEYVEWCSKRKNVKTKEDEEQERKEYRKLMNRENELKKQDVELLFKLMQKHILSWWD